MTLLHEDALSIASDLAARKVSAPEVVQACLRQIKAQDPKIRAFLHVDDELALERAQVVQKELDHGHAASPLSGVPLAVKDNLCSPGMPTTCASRMLAGFAPPHRATVLQRAEDAGLITLGKTNMDEFAMGITTETSAFGPTHNPWNLEHAAGGSSGGSAAALASHQAFLALGSDTGGSVRQPSAHCNLTGLKPTYGSLSRYGLISYASSLDQVAPLARSAADLAAFFSLLAAPDHRDSTSLAKPVPMDLERLLAMRDAPRLEGLTLGVLDLEDFPSMQPEILAALQEARLTLSDLGVRLVPIRLPLLRHAVSTYYLIACAEASSNLARYDGIQYGHQAKTAADAGLGAHYEATRSEGFGEEVKRRILLGTFALSSGYYDEWYLKALKVRRLIMAQLDEALSGVQALLLPVTAATAPRLAKEIDPLSQYQSDRFTVLANLSGRPALALPCGIDRQGLPMGLQLMGHHGQDQELLRLGIAYQAATDHHRQKAGRKESAHGV